MGPVPDGFKDTGVSNVAQYRNEQVPARWLGRGGTRNWPPRSPDFIILHYYVWVKGVTWGTKARWTQETNFISEFLMTQDTSMTLQFFVKLNVLHLFF
jgi:hypothetical protein